jgi:hypothetical protein
MPQRHLKQQQPLLHVSLAADDVADGAADDS